MAGKEERLVVSLNGGGPWGFRLQGGAGTGLPLIVSKVRRKSKAYRRLREGDRILCVNGRPCDGLTYDQLMDIADKCGSDLTLEILRKECDKENQAPRQESSVKTIREVENMPATKEVVSFTETSTKISDEKEGLRIKSATVVPESKAFETFTSSILEERPAEKGPAQAVEPFPPFKDIQNEAHSGTCTSSKQETVTGDDQNYTKTTVERKHEVKGDTETSFVKREQESFSKSSSDSHGMPDITMDTIDLNNLISETQKRLESFKNNFQGNGILDSSLGEIRRNEKMITSTLRNETIKSSNTMSGLSPSLSMLSETKNIESSNEMRELPSLPTLSETKNIESSDEMRELPSLSTNLKTENIESSNAMSETPVQKESTSLEKNEKLEVSQKTDPVKKVPPPTLPKPKIHPTFDAFKDCLKEMEMDPIFSLPDVGFTSESSETSSITTDIPFGSSTTTVTKKKKMFSSSSFYEEPHSIYPTLEEQVEMARKIADSLADDNNKKSKGANMFYKRVKRSSKWIHEGPEPSDESGPGTPEVQGVEPPTPDPTQVPFRLSKGPPKLKLILDPRHPLDLNALRSSGYIISEHNVVSPEVCHGLVKDLHSPVGKGAALFAKRKKKSEEWIVDEEKVKTLLREQHEKKFSAPPLSTSPAMNQYPSLGRQDVKLMKSPWDAALESPYGFCDAAFYRVHPDQLADTVMKRADSKRSESLSRESSRMEGCISPPITPSLTPAAALYDVYHAKPPKGWLGNSAPVDYSSQSTTMPLPPVSSTIPQQTRNVQSGFQASKKMVFQNFNTVPRLWKGASVH